jgi:hypothetical protein
MSDERKKWLALALVLSGLLLIAIGVAIYESVQPGPTPTGLRHVATDGTDSGDCKDSPCLTVDYAWRQAAQGDTIKLACGVYPGQRVDHDPAKDANSDFITVTSSTPGCAHVGAQTTLTGPVGAGASSLPIADGEHFKPDTVMNVGAWNSVKCKTVAAGLLSGCTGMTSTGWHYTAGGQIYQGGLDIAGARWLRVEGLTVTELDVHNGGGRRSEHLDIANNQLTVFYISDTDESTVAGNTVGPYTMERPSYLTTQDGYGNRDLRFTGNTLHDINSSDCDNTGSCSHMECLFVTYAKDLVFDGNRVFNCSGAADVFIQNWLKAKVPAGTPAASRGAEDLTFSNNYFGSDQFSYTGVNGAAHAWEYDAQAGGDSASNVFLYNNSAFTTSADGIYTGHGDISRLTGFRAWANTGFFPGTSSCAKQPFDFQFNVLRNPERAGICGTTDKNPGAAVEYVDAAGGNLDLAGAPGPADGFVPADFCTAHDMYGTQRKSPCDAGGYER